MHDLRAVATVVATSPAGRVRGWQRQAAERLESRNLLPLIGRIERTDAGVRLCPGRQQLFQGCPARGRP